jgi:hypothetical protein
MELSFLLKTPLPEAVLQQAVQECLQVDADNVHVYMDAQLDEDNYDANHVNVFVWNKPDKEWKQAIAISSNSTELALPEQTLQGHVDFLREFCQLTEIPLALIGGERQFPFLAFEQDGIYPVLVDEDEENDNLFVRKRLNTSYGALLSPEPFDLNDLLPILSKHLNVPEESLSANESFNPLPEEAREQDGFAWIRQQGFFEHGLELSSAEAIEWIASEQAVERWLNVVKEVAIATGQVFYAWHYGLKYFRQTPHGLDFYGESYRVLPNGLLEKVVYKLFHHRR